MDNPDPMKERRRYRPEIDAEMAKVLESAQFINGAAVKELEAALAGYVGARHAIGCSSGTDALMLGLLALGVKPGDEIIVPDFTFFATAEVPAFLGAVPVFVDVRPDTLMIDPSCVERAITAKTKGMIPVSLYGQCPDFSALEGLASRSALGGSHSHCGCFVLPGKAARLLRRRRCRVHER
jgi:UDP-2-acetamido-2-deoxy-ribo-hexuluronate aminotransferase